MSLLQVESVSKAFGGVVALQDVSFGLEAGEILGLIGPNGAGKSTLVNIATGVYPVDGGSVRLNGIRLHNRRPSEIARLGVGRTFQTPRPFPDLSVRENVMIGAFTRNRGLAEARTIADGILRLTELDRLADSRAADLTLEYRKRLDMARALAIAPKVLFLDEVMAGLNPHEMNLGIELIKRVAATGVAVLFIEHVMDAVVKLCPNVIVLNYGKLIAAGSTDAVLNTPAVVEAYIGGEVDGTAPA